MTTTIGTHIDRERTRRVIEKHLGPGDHPGGTPQSTHGRGSRNASTRDIKSTTEDKGGLTIRTQTGERPERGFAVAISGRGKEVGKLELSRDVYGLYLRENFDILQSKGFFLGMWIDVDNELTALDVVKVMDADQYVEAFDAAAKFGKNRGERAIYDLLNETEIKLTDEAIAAYREGLT